MLCKLISEYIYIGYCLLAMKYWWQKDVDKRGWKYTIAFSGVLIVFLVERKTGMEDVFMYPFEILCVLFLSHSKRIMEFMKFLLADIVLSLQQRVIVYIAIVLKINNYESFLHGGVERLILNFLTLILVVITHTIIEKYMFYIRRLTWYHIVIGVLIGTCLIVLIAQAEIGIFFNSKEIVNYMAMASLFILCFLILGFMAFFIVVDINRKHYQEQSRLKDEYLIMQEEYYKIIGNKNREARKIRHDIKAHLSCIEILLQQEHYGEVSDYIKDLKNDTIKRIDTEFQSGNDIINAVLIDIAKNAKKHKTKLIFDGTLPPNMKIESPELCSLFYNLLSNSEEAMRSYEGILPREITVEVSFFKNNVGIVVKNPVMQPVKIDNFKRKYTTKDKKEEHGYGMENIKTIVNKYKGMMEVENIKGQFVVKIIFSDIVNYE